MPAPRLQVPAMRLFQSLKAECPRMKCSELRDNAVYFVFDLFSSLGERWNVFLPDVLFNPMACLSPMPSIINLLDPLIPFWITTSSLKAICKAWKNTPKI
jgi:hypothetical protein